MIQGEAKKEPKELTARYSIRLRKSDHQQIASVSDDGGFAAGVRHLLRFFLRWKGVEVDLKSNLKMYCAEFSQITNIFLKFRESGNDEDSKHCLGMMNAYASFIKDQHKLIDDPDLLYLKEQCFNNSKYFTYLTHIWEKHVI